MASPYSGARLGTRFGPYEMRSLIGVGGMGEVYRAYDTVKERTVAVKVLRAELAADPNFQARFRRESRVAARLQEPHIIPVHDFGDIEGALYIDMRLVEGASLKEVLRQSGPLEPARAASIITQVASALDAAHADGLVHRDIKPENVLLTPGDFAYLVDFGIAHAGGEASVTMTGMLVGSSAYMAPERFNGEPVGPPADIYSLTCLLYESLTGRPPYEAGDLRQLMSAHMFSPAPRPSIMRRGISRAFDEVVARGMAKDPAERYPTAAELAKAATAAASSSAPSVAPGPAAPVTSEAPQINQPPSTRQFSTLYPSPVDTGYTPYQPPPPPPPVPPRKRRWGSTQIALAAAVIGLFAIAAVLAAVLVFSNRTDTASETIPPVPKTSGNAQDEITTSSTTTPSTTTTTTTPSTTSSTTTTTKPGAVAPVDGADAQGFTGHSARCNGGDNAAAMIRTASSLAVICQGGSGYYYRGERLSDGAHLEIASASPAGGGFDAVNPADGARYQVRPDSLTIMSGGKVDSSEPALQYAGG